MSGFYPPASNQNTPGLMSAEAYQQIAFVPPTDPTDTIPTTGASNTYTEVDVTNVTSTIDPTITNIGYKRCHDNGHAATSKLTPTLLFPGFSQSGRSSFPDALAQRMASYVDPASGRAPLVIKTQTRGRGNLGTIDYARDGQDYLDILNHAVSAVGSNVFGYSATENKAPAICIGYSTGALDALLFASRFPDRCLGVVLYFPNYDNGYHPDDSYYFKSPSSQTAIASHIQPGGDVRLTGGLAGLDQYMARNAIDAVTRIMALPNGPHVWIIGDTDDNVALPSRERLRDALQSIPAAKAKTHVHITATGDSNRVLHDDGVNGASEIYAERYYFPFLLKNATEWTMPQESPASGFMILGWMKTKLFELWLGPNTNPRSAAGAGGKDHVAEFHYDHADKHYEIETLTTTNGYVQIITDGDDQSEAFTAYVNHQLNLSYVPAIAAVTDINIEKAFTAESGVTDSSGVTNWVDSIGGVYAFTASANKPSYGTDGNGKKYIQFDAASSQKMVMNSLIVDPVADFYVYSVASKTDTSGPGVFVEWAHHGTTARQGILYNSGVDNGYAYNDAGAWAIANTNGLGGNTVSQNVLHTYHLMRKSGVLYEAMDNGPWTKSAFSSDVFTKTGTNETTIGAGWANGGGAYWHFLTGRIYEVGSKQSAISFTDRFSLHALMKVNHSF